MKRFPMIMILALVLAFCLSFMNTNARADVDLKILKQLRIKEKPLAVDASLDGQELYILVKGKLIIYPLAEGKGEYSIPVNKSFDRLKIIGANGAIILLSTSESLVEIIELEFIKRFNVSGLPFRGPDNAPVTICAFINYQCPHCERLQPLLQEALDKYPGKVKIVFKNLPFQGDQVSFRAAAGALAAKEQNRFWEYHQMLFANFEKLDEIKIPALAAQLGLDMNKFNLDMQSPSIQGMINGDISEALQADISTIPAVFINGKRLKEPTFEELQKMIEAELNKQLKSLPPPGK